MHNNKKDEIGEELNYYENSFAAQVDLSILALLPQITIFSLHVLLHHHFARFLFPVFPPHYFKLFFNYIVSPFLNFFIFLVLFTLSKLLQLSKSFLSLPKIMFLINRQDSNLQIMP